MGESQILSPEVIIIFCLCRSNGIRYQIFGIQKFKPTLTLEVPRVSLHDPTDAGHIYPGFNIYSNISTNTRASIYLSSNPFAQMAIER